MPEPDILDLIARKEQELRARLLAARARADAEVADAAARAARLRAEREQSARAELDAWREAEIARVQRGVAGGAALADASWDEAGTDVGAAADVVVAAVLPRPAASRAERPPGRPG